MSFLPVDMSFDAVVSPIKQTGNYFILDSEQLVSNPYNSMRSEAQNEFQRKHNNNQKITSVRNKVCENYYRNTQDLLEKSKDRNIQKIHENKSNCRFHMKLLELDRRKADVEFRKRLEPEANFDYDDSQIVSSSRRLCADINTPYLEKKLKHPVRQRGIDVTSVTPAVAKARESLKNKRLHREYEEIFTERARSSNTFHSRASSKLRSTKSAPVVFDRIHKKEMKSATTLPIIEKRNRQRQQSVRFEPHKVDRGERLERTAEILNIQVKNPRKVPTYDNEDSDDDFAEYEKVDLRAILFGKKNESKIKPTISVKKSEFSDSSDDEPEPEPEPKGVKEHHPHQSGHSAHSRITLDLPHHKPHQPITPELLHRQFETVQKKVNTFIKEFNTEKKKRKKHWFECSSDEEEEEKENEKKTEERKEDNPFTLNPRVNDNKEAWEYIQGHHRDGHLEGTYSMEDLVLQQLTGMNVAKSRTVPLNSAFRALRKTPTFKMRQALEKMKSNQSRFEEHEMNELRNAHDREGLEFGEFIDLSNSGQPNDENITNFENIENEHNTQNNDNVENEEVVENVELNLNSTIM